MITSKNIEWLFQNKLKLNDIFQSNPEILSAFPNATNYLKNVFFEIIDADFPLLIDSITEFLRLSASNIGNELFLLISQLEASQIKPAEQPATSSPQFHSFIETVAEHAKNDKESITKFTCQLHSIYHAKPELLEFIVNIVLPIWLIFLEHINSKNANRPPLEILTPFKTLLVKADQYTIEEYTNFQKLFLDHSLAGPSGTNFHETPSKNLPYAVSKKLIETNQHNLLIRLNNITSPNKIPGATQYHLPQAEAGSSKQHAQSSSYMGSSIDASLVKQLTRLLSEEEKYIEFMYQERELTPLQQLAQGYLEAFLEMLRDHLNLRDEDTFSTQNPNNILMNFLSDIDKHIANFLAEKDQEMREVTRIKEGVKEQTLALLIEAYLNFVDEELSKEKEVGQPRKLSTEPLQGLPVEPEEPMQGMRPNISPTEALQESNMQHLITRASKLGLITFTHPKPAKGPLNYFSRPTPGGRSG